MATSRLAVATAVLFQLFGTLSMTGCRESRPAASQPPASLTAEGRNTARPSDTPTAVASASRAGETAKVMAMIDADPLALHDRSFVGMTPLSLAVSGRHPDLVKVLLERGANPNIPDLMGFTSLSWAALVGSEEIARILLLHGAAVNQVNAEGATPLMAAVIANHLKVARLLIENGADVSAKDVYGKTAADRIGPESDPALRELLRAAEPAREH